MSATLRWLAVADCAQALDLNERTVYRDWSAARAWLGSEMA